MQDRSFKRSNDMNRLNSDYGNKENGFRRKNNRNNGTNFELISTQEVINDFEKVFNDENSSKQNIIDVIKKYVPNFMHIETGKHLDQKM